VLERALARERQARRAAEEIAEEVTTRLHQLNQELDSKVKEATRDLEQREEEIRRSHAELTEALKMRDNFLAGMTHELRSPLHSILGLSEVLLEEAYGPINERQKRSLDTIFSSGSHLLQLINNVLEVSKLSAGGSELQVEPVDVPAVCAEAMELVRAQAERKKIHLSLEADPRVTHLQANTLQVKQILVNLLSNAVKFTPEGGRVVLITSQDNASQAVELTVTDSGIGISEDDFGKLFRPFAQLNGGLERSAEGSGLGLLLVQRMVDLYGGGVSVKSIPGQGSAFRVSLPCMPSKDSNGREHRSSHRVVLIDDSSVNRTIVRRMLTRYPLEVLEEVDGLLGMELVRIEKPSLIFLDLYMPKLDGYDVLRLLKSDPALKDIPVAIISGVDTPKNQEQCLELGASAYFTKPVQRASLESWLEECLGKNFTRSS